MVKPQYMKAMEVRNDTMSMSLMKPASRKKKPMRQRMMPFIMPSHHKRLYTPEYEDNSQKVGEYQL